MFLFARERSIQYLWSSLVPRALQLGRLLLSQRRVSRNPVELSVLERDYMSGGQNGGRTLHTSTDDYAPLAVSHRAVNRRDESNGGASSDPE